MKKGDNWRSSAPKGRCQAHGKKNPCGQCRTDTLKREAYLARERSTINEQLFVRHSD